MITSYSNQNYDSEARGLMSHSYFTSVRMQCFAPPMSSISRPRSLYQRSINYAMGSSDFSSGRSGIMREPRLQITHVLIVDRKFSILITPPIFARLTHLQSLRVRLPLKRLVTEYYIIHKLLG